MMKSELDPSASKTKSEAISPTLGSNIEVEAAAFRRLVAHLQSRTDVQNIDLMNLAGFCRNCLSKWYRAEAQDRHIEIEDLDVRAMVYGMPYPEWKKKYQTPR